MTLDIDSLEVKNNPEEKRFEIKLGHQIAFVEYLLAGTNIVFTHTEVPAAFEGQGIGNKLAKFVLDYAIEHGYKIQPLCPFINAYVHRHKEYLPHVWNM
jgi:predicted GNAT family acetyltransferase